MNIMIDKISDLDASTDNDKKEEAKRIAIEALWRKGDLRYLLRPHQYKIYNKIRKAIENRIPLTGLNICRQTGKTHVMSIITIEECIRKNDITIQFLAPVFKNLVDRTWPIYNKILKDCPVDLLPSFKSATNQYVFNNNSTIYFYAVNNAKADDIRGGAVHLAFIDEAGFVDKLDYVVKSVVIPSFKETKGSAFITSTPPATAGHPYVELYKQCEEQDNVVKMDVYEDTTMTEEEINSIAFNLGGKDSIEFRREYMCEFITDKELQIFKDWNKRFIITKTHELANYKLDQYYQYWDKLIAIDYGTRDYTSVVFAHYNFGTGNLIIEDEYYDKGNKMTTDLLAENIKAKIKELWGDTKPYRITADTSDKYVTNTLRIVHNINAVPVVKNSLQNMVNGVNLMLRAGNIYVDERCKYTIGCFENGIWDGEDNIGLHFGRSPKYGHYDACASTMYMIKMLVRNHNPIPNDIGYNPMTHYKVPELQKEENNIINNITKANPYLRSIQDKKKYNRTNPIYGL